MCWGGGGGVLSNRKSGIFVLRVASFGACPPMAPEQEFPILQIKWFGRRRLRTLSPWSEVACRYLIGAQKL